MTRCSGYFRGWARSRFLGAVTVFGVVGGMAVAQGPGGLPDAPVEQGARQDDGVSLQGTPARIGADQRVIWTSPARLRAHDLEWALPVGAAIGAAIATDHHAMQSLVTRDVVLNQDAVNGSNVVIGGLIAAPVAFYGYGHWKEDEHARETGVLGAEALLDGVVVEQGIKLIFWRERPNQDNGRGLFFQSRAGWDSSFPSSHSVLAWSSAAVIASEYPTLWKQIAIYGLAAGVSATRVVGQEHFPSDVLVGSAAGWLVGRYVYRVHHRHDGWGHSGAGKGGF